MNKDRIQINGDGYVKEILEEKAIVLVITQTQGYAVENNEFCFEATRLINKNTKLPYPDDICLTITDKRNPGWEADYWDNKEFLLGVLSGHKTFLKQLYSWSKKDINYLQAFLKFLKEEDWL